ncbi:MAG: acyl-CoA dehydrogenase family protein [Acidimicrobiia bacterium]
MSHFPDVDPLLIETADKAFASSCTHSALQDAERDGWAPAVWGATADIGLQLISVPEENGGVGGTLVDALAVLFTAGRHAAPIPLAENGVIAGWLAASAGLTLPDGVVTAVTATNFNTLRVDGGKVSGSAKYVPWARKADTIVALADSDGGPQVVMLNAADLTVDQATNIAGEPRDAITASAVTPVATAAANGADAASLRLRAGLARAAQMAGALERMSEITVGYTNERHQFGKPISSFQAIQQHLVHTAQDAAIVTIAVATAARVALHGDARFEIASAVTLADDAAVTASRAAHQAHGAMGLTQEYTLHHFSRRLWAWRHEFGGPRAWTTDVAGYALQAGPDGLYPLITGGTAMLVG